jgi:plastocyanin
MDTGAVADLGAPSPPFVPIVPCDRAASYVDGTASVETNLVAYQPQCLRVRVGSFVTIEASVAHPLEPRPGGSPGNPIPMQNSRATISFPTPGFYPFQCPEHVDQGMLGVVWVTE